MSVCLSWFSVCWQKRQFFGFSAYRQGFVSVLCGRLQCKSLLCGEREPESGGFQLCSTAMAGWERPLLCVRRVTDGWGRFLKSWVKVIQHAYPLNQSFTFPPAARALAVCYWTGGVWAVSEMRRQRFVTLMYIYINIIYSKIFFIKTKSYKILIKFMYFSIWAFLPPFIWLFAFICTWCCTCGHVVFVC